MREEFEKLPKVAEVIKKYDGYRIGNKYSTYDTAYTAWLNGAWYAFQEQQKKIDGALKELELLNYYRTGNSDNAIKILKGTDK